MTGPTGPAVRAGRDGDGGAARGTPEERLRALGIVDAPGPPDHRDAPDPDADARVRATLAAEPGPRMPPHVLAGIDRALAAERPGTAPGPPERAPGARVVRSFRSRSPLALLAVTLLLVAVVGVIAVAARPGAPAPQAARRPLRRPVRSRPRVGRVHRGPGTRRSRASVAPTCPVPCAVGSARGTSGS